MDDSERRSVKRSRFDQTEPEPGKRSSRFDRRSRSRSPPPPRRNDDRGAGTASPAGAKSPGEAAAAAAAAAAKINAALQARKAIQTVDVPPVRAVASPSAQPSGTAPSASGGNIASTIDGEMYIADGDYIKDIEVNDLRNRYTLTKGSTQKMIKEETGADVTTRGNYYPDKSMATAANPPLYLHVTSTSKAGLQKAVEKIEELMKQELPNLIDERRFRRREPDAVERDEFGRRKWPEERIPIDFDPIPGFNLRAQVVGHQGAYVKHIQAETRCRVQIKGRGSGFTESSTGQESDEPMYLHVAGPDPKEVENAKSLCLDLLANVREQYEEYKARGPRGGYNQSTGYGGQGGYGDRPQERRQNYASDRGDRGDYGDRGGYSGGGSYNGGGGGYNSPAVPATSTSDATPNDAAIMQYAAYYAAQAAQGDASLYPSYLQYYQQYLAASYAQQGAAGLAGPPGAAPAAPSASPPPPPSEAPPPPPPSSGPPSGSRGYGHVPPPPGL